MKTTIVFLAAALFAVLCQTACLAGDSIGWIPTWKQGWSEAQRTRKPILLVAGAPQCNGVPGVW